MSKIIQYNPVNQITITNKSPKQKIKSIDQIDSFELSSDFGNISTNQKKVKARATTNFHILNTAWNYYDEAIAEKKRTSELIALAENTNFTDMQNKDGNLITFEEDNLGRMVMIECDRNGRDKIRTTFTPYEDKIWKIEKLPHTKIVFFDFGKDYTEIIKTSSNNILGQSTKEVYCYENGKPLSYNKYRQSSLKKAQLISNLKLQ